ncbi:MAG: futalosine hydrolase [Trueperaceae bacterium]|nr:futalosine hydrolase [Trueperaceae bacterium]
MSDAPLLIAAATATELAPLDAALDGARDVGGGRAGRLEGRPVVLVATGVGKAAAAAGVAAHVARYAPAAVLHVGVAGAYVGAFLPVGATVAAASEVDLDVGVATHASAGGARIDPMTDVDFPLPGATPVPTDAAWREALATAAGLPPEPFATSDAASGDLDVAADRAARSGAAVESMEGVAVAVACAAAGVPFAEVRGIANVAGVRDKAQWELAAAVRGAAAALRGALRAA